MSDLGGQSRGQHAVLLAVHVVRVRVFAVVHFLTRFTSLLKAGSCGGCGGRRLVRQHFLSEDLGGQGWQGSNTSLEVVSVPVAGHMSALQVRGAECNLARIAREGVRKCVHGGRGRVRRDGRGGHFRRK